MEDITIQVTEKDREKLFHLLDRMVEVCTNNPENPNYQNSRKFLSEFLVKVESAKIHSSDKGQDEAVGEHLHIMQSKSVKLDDRKKGKRTRCTICTKTWDELEKSNHEVIDTHRKLLSRLAHDCNGGFFGLSGRYLIFIPLGTAKQLEERFVYEVGIAGFKAEYMGTEGDDYSVYKIHAKGFETVMDWMHKLRTETK